MKSINFEILQRDTFLKFLSEMVKINNSILLEFDLQEDLVISKTHFDTKIIRKNELKLSEIFKFNKSDITIDKLKGKIIFSIFDLAVLVKIINKFVTDGDTLVLCHEDFNFVTNRKGSKSNNNVTMVDRPSVDLTQVLIKTEGDTKATYIFDCGEFKDYIYFTDSFVDELSSDDKHQFTVKFDEKELNHLLELNNSFSNNSEKLTIQVKDNVVTFADKNWKFSWKLTLNNSVVDGAGELKIESSSVALKDSGVSTEFTSLKIGEDTIVFTDKNAKSMVLIVNEEDAFDDDTN